MKYFLSLGCIIKDEDYLEEFLVYYRILGVEHFFIYDNNSKLPIYNRLKETKLIKFCTIIPWTGHQVSAYKNLIKTTKNITKWLIIIDGDEYILPKKHKCLRTFLNDYKDYHAIGINWVMYGSSNYDRKQDGFIIDNYRYNTGIQDRHIKTICKPLYVNDIICPHSIIPTDPDKYIDPYKRKQQGPFNINKTTDIIQINHYWGKSTEDMLQKINRGRPNHKPNREFSNNYHTQYNSHYCTLIIDKYLNQLIFYQFLTHPTTII